MTASYYQPSLLGINGVVVNMPTIIGSKGVEFMVSLKLNDTETEHLHDSAETLKNTLSQVDLGI